MGLKKANDGKHLGSTPKLYITASRVLTQSKCDKKIREKRRFLNVSSYLLNCKNRKTIPLIKSYTASFFTALRNTSFLPFSSCSDDE